MEKLNGLDLFSGIGGITLALEPWVKPIAYCEINRHAQAVLLSRMSEGILPNAPIWDDVRTLHGKDLPKIDIIYGGFPCQDVSLAGLGKGLEGERTGLFWEVIRLVTETKPKFIFLENVPGIEKYRNSIKETLTKLGYSCRDGYLSAGEVHKSHWRDRWFLLAYANSEGKLQQEGIDQEIWGWVDYSYEETDKLISNQGISLLADGIPAKMVDFAAMGNAVVPEQAREAFKRLSGISYVSGAR